MKVFNRQQVENNLLQLYTPETVRKERKQYYRKKCEVVIALVILGVFLGIGKMSGLFDSWTGEKGYIYRGDEEETRIYTLYGKNSKKSKTIQLEVAARIPNEAVLQDKYEQFKERIADYVIKKNTDLTHIRHDLNLLGRYDDMPFDIRWSSNRPEIVESDGTVHEVYKEESVILHAEITNGDFRKNMDIEILVLPPEYSAEEQKYNEIEKFVVQYEQDNREMEKIPLPRAWNGEELVWDSGERIVGVLILLTTPILGIAVWFAFDNDLKKKVGKRQKKLKMEYPSVVRMLTLYIGAGMTIRGAIQKLGTDCENKMKQGEKAWAISEELVRTCRELQTGVAQEAAYECLGKRSGIKEYVKMCALLSQNLKHGNDTLIERLREEADKASDSEMQEIRRLGEEAGTKLLIPMTLLLGVVLLLIIIPAFNTM